MKAVLAVLAAAAAAAAVSAAPAFAHGGEAAATGATPARTLVQQALAVMTQKNDPAEARELLEAAVESKHRERVQISAVRDALELLESGDSKGATEHMNVALASGEKAEEGKAEEGAGHQEGEEADDHAGGGTSGAAAVLDHPGAFEPARGTEEWIALVFGVVLLLAALGVLFVQRRAD